MGLPLYQTLSFDGALLPPGLSNNGVFKAVVAPFGRLLVWHEGANKTKTFLECLVISPERIPHSFVVSQGSVLDGNGRSWTAPVFVIGGQFLDAFPPDEDLVPHNGVLHPPHGHVMLANPNVPMHWIHDLAGGGNMQFGDMGINQDKVNKAMQDL